MPDGLSTITPQALEVRICTWALPTTVLLVLPSCRARLSNRWWDFLLQLNRAKQVRAFDAAARAVLCARAGVKAASISFHARRVSHVGYGFRPGTEEVGGAH